MLPTGNLQYLNALDPGHLNLASVKCCAV